MCIRDSSMADGEAAAITHALAEATGVAAAREAAVAISAAECGTADAKVTAITHALAEVTSVAAAR